MYSVNWGIWYQPSSLDYFCFYLRSPSLFNRVRVARPLIFCVVFCRSMFILLFFFFWPLYYLSVVLRLLITLLISSNFSLYWCNVNVRNIFWLSRITFQNYISFQALNNMVVIIFPSDKYMLYLDILLAGTHVFDKRRYNSFSFTTEA